MASISAVLSNDMELRADVLSCSPSYIELPLYSCRRSVAPPVCYLWVRGMLVPDGCCPPRWTLMYPLDPSSLLSFGSVVFLGTLFSSLGVEWSAGMVEVNFSVSWFDFVVMELLILLTNLSILRLMRSGLLGFFVAGVLMNTPGSFEVNVVAELPCDESAARLMTSIDLFL